MYAALIFNTQPAASNGPFIAVMYVILLIVALLVGLSLWKGH